MLSPKPSAIAMWVFIVGVSGALTWFAFIKYNIDPYDLGIATSVSGYAEMTLANGSTSTYSFASCEADGQIVLSGDGSKLVLYEGRVWTFSSKEQPLLQHLDCQNDKYYVVRSKTRLGRGTSVGHSNYSGDLDVTCSDSMNNQYHIVAKFQNCR